MANNEVKICMPKKLYDLIERDVVNLYVELELSIPIKPSAIAKHLGYIVKKFSEIASADNDNMLAFRFGKDGERRDGLSYYDSRLGAYVICVNDIDSFYIERNEFTIMHEIGHIRMNHREDSHLAEMIANYYAAYALVPSPLVDIYNCSSHVDVLETFEVSMDCAHISWNRYMNWYKHFGVKKQYEKELVSYYKKKLEVDRRL